MSHIPHLGGYSSAAGQYQEYLGSLRAARRSRHSPLTGAADEPLSFDSPIDPDQEPDQQAREEGPDPDQEHDQEQEQESPPEETGSEGLGGLNEHA